MKRGVLIAVTVGVVAALASAGVFVWKGPAPAINASNITVSPYEERVFHAYELNNGLSVLLVSDPESEKAAAAMNVSVGSWSDPDDIQGMAHFLEHMLFLGTEKYPGVDDYNRFIEQNGGSNNAYTAPENTLYFFDIGADHLEGALDRFSQFFIAPLFDADYLQREINAVHSEYTASLQNDSRRRDDVLRELHNPNHPASRLTIGNRDTLNHDQLRQRMIEFYRQHYVAERQSLVVYGPQSVDTLRGWVDDRFNNVRSVSSERPVFTQDLFESTLLPALVEVTPRRELHQLEMRFPVPGNLEYRLSKPDGFIAHLLGHEAPGSLLSLLKERGWAEAISARSGGLSASNRMFTVSFLLTPEGVEHWQDVAELLFSYLRQIEQNGLEEWRYDELQRINTIQFEFAEQVSPMATVQRLAERLSLYDAEDVLVGPFRFESFEPDTLRQWLRLLQPDNALAVLMHPGAETELESQWYQTPYRLTPLTGNRLAQWRSPPAVAELRLPAANPFIPSQFVVLPLATPQSTLFTNDPQVIATEPGYTLWFEQDDVFRTPKLDITLLLESARFSTDAQAKMRTQLYLDLVNDALNELRYEAGLAGSGYALTRTARGIQVRLYGYSETLPALLDALLVELTEHEIRPARFDSLKAELSRRLRNTSDDPVMNQVIRRLNEFLVEGNHTPAQLLQALEGVNQEDLNSFRDEHLSPVRITALIHGNMTEAQALAMGERIRTMMPIDAESAQVEEAIAALPSRRFRHNMRIDHRDSAMLAYYQANNNSLNERARYALLGHILATPYFTELRTEEQLGYIVFARSWETRSWPGLVAYIQSPETDPALLQLFSDRFMGRYLQRLRGLSESEFNLYKAGLINQITMPDKNLYELSQSYWQAIVEGNQHFNTRNRLAIEVNTISRDGFIRFFENELIGDDARRLVIHQVGAPHADDYQRHLEAVVGFHSAEGLEDVHSRARWSVPVFNNLGVENR
ncbi:MAG: insulinase family protein [Saccharospirillum sp.]|nr:insulinase family protein [Saccharospirillum sp.]